MKYRPAILLTLLAALCLTPCALAASTEAEQAAEALHALNLFRGTGEDGNGSPVYDLDAVPSRNQAVMMLVRLLGAEEDANTHEWDIPFTDVIPGTQSYHAIGYAYAHGLTKGTTDTTYSGVQPVSRNQYLLFLLRAMRYDDPEAVPPLYPADAPAIAKELGILRDGDSGEDAFTRGDVALFSFRALDTDMKYVTSEEMGGGAVSATLREYLGLGWSPAREQSAEPLRTGRTEELVIQKFDSEEAARAYRFGEGIGVLQVEQELPVPAGGETAGGTVLYWSFGGVPHGPAPRLGFVQTDGTLFRLPLPRTGFFGELAAPEDLTFDGTSLTWTVSVSAEMSRHPTGRAVTYFYRYVPGAERVYVVQQLENEQAGNTAE
ncbi:MAG: S-layer homology domain-containing protein [Oscillibacter sp.]|nr:S-layer homology domain-containing protein [Oscillibacter sp.]